MSRDCCCHRHSFKGKTNCACCHYHEVKGKTEYAENYCCHHTHYVECETKKEDGHRHCVCLETSKPYYCCDGSHYHYIDGACSCKDCHKHCVEACTDTHCD